MGKNLTDDIMKLTLVVNGNPARKELNTLGQATYDLEQKNKQLRLAREKLAAQGKKNTVADKQLAAQMRANARQITQNKNRMATLRKQMGLNMLTTKELRAESKKLKAQLDNATPGTKEWRKYDQALERVKAQMDKNNAASAVHNKTIKTKSGLLASARSHFLGFAAAAATVFYSTKEWIRGNVGLSDSFADVMKTTGLTRKEVGELMNDFKKLNTRTPRKELLALAEEAGRLGKKSKKDVMDFLEVANQIKIALGDDLGENAEQSIKEVGKLTNIFKVGEKHGVNFRKAMLMVGSSINEVSANSTAQADYLIDIMKRMAGVTEQANLSADSVIGYASALDQLGQSKEVSGTTMNRVMIDMFKDVGTYADVAGMETKEFLQLLRTDANEAFLKMLEGLNNNNKGFDTMVSKLDSLNLKGVRSIQVLSALAGSTELIRKEQKLANVALVEGTSLTKEYELRNNNLAGSFSKIGEYIKSKFINSGAVNWIERVVNGFAKWTEVPLSKTMKDTRMEMNKLVMQIVSLDEGTDDHKKLLNQLVSTYPDYWKQVDIAKTSNSELLTMLEGVNRQMIRQIYIQGRREELKELQENAAKKLGVEMRYQETLQNLKTKYFARMGKTQRHAFTYDFDFLMKNFERIKKGSKGAVQAAMKTTAWLDKNQLSKRFKGGLDYKDMQILNVAYNDWLEAYRNKYKAEKQAQDEEDRIMSMERKWFDKKSSLKSGQETPISDITGFTLKEITDYWNAVSLGIIEGESKVRILTEEELEKLTKALKKQTQDAADFRQQLIYGSKSLIDQERIAYEERLKKAGLYNKERSKLTEEELEALEILEKEHQSNISQINADTVNKGIIDQKKAFDQETTLRKTKHNEELQALGNNEEAKKNLDEQFKQEELQRNIDFLNKVKFQLYNAIQNGEWNGINLADNLLSDEDKELLIQKLNEVGLSITDLQLKITTLEEEKKDIFGMTRSDWDELFIDLEKVWKGISYVENIWSSLNQKAANEDRKALKEYEKNLNRKKDLLNDRLESGQISQEEYNAKVAKLDTELDQKKEELQAKQQRRENELATFQILTNTAMAIMKIWSQWGWPLGAVFSAFAATAGAVQIAALPSVDQAYKGDYDRMPVIGKDDGMTYKASVSNNTGTRYITDPTLLVAERKPEWIIDGDTSNRLKKYYPEAIQMVQWARDGRAPNKVQQFASGDYTNMPPVSSSINTSSTQEIIIQPDPEQKQLNQQILEVLQYIADEGVHMDYAKFKQFQKQQDYIDSKTRIKP